MGGQVAIEPAKERAHAWDHCEPGERAGPPDGARQKQERIGAAEYLALRSEQEHFLRLVRKREVQAFAQPGRLQRREVEPAAGEKDFEARGPGAAERAGGVIEEP